MSGPDDDKHYRSSAFQPCRSHVSAAWPMLTSTLLIGVLIVLFAALCAHADAVAGSAPPKPRFMGAAYVMGETPAAALVIDSVCKEILRGDFESAQ